MPIIAPQDIPGRPDGLRLVEVHRFWRGERILRCIFGAIVPAALSGSSGPEVR